MCGYGSMRSGQGSERVTYPRSREGAAPTTVRLEDLALSDRESRFYAPRAGDLALLGVLVAVLLGNGAWIWRQLGAESEAGRAVFFGMLLLCVYWCAIVYIFKLSLSVRVSPRSIGVARGPWQVEIRWSELTRLMERMQTIDGRRYRWVIAMARDGRRISVREDAIGDYARFRRETYERYRLWRDHGGTWGATGSGPFVARETARDEAQWWGVGALMIALPGLYFALLLPETNPLGYLLLAGTVACLVMLARTFLVRQRYTIERQYSEARSAVKRTRLTWSEVAKVERVRHPVSGVILSGVALGRLALRLASRGDAGIRSFAWSPRVPEYLILRGGGRQIRIRLHRLMQPDELLAWIEFYDQVRRSPSPTRSRPMSGPLTEPRAGAATGPTSGPLSAPNLTPDLSGASGPLDPWGAGRQGEPTTGQSAAPHTLKTPFVARTPTTPRLPDLPDASDLPTSRTPAASQDDSWLRETGRRPSVGAYEAPPLPADNFTPEPWSERAGWQAESASQPLAARHEPLAPGGAWSDASQRWADDLWGADDSAASHDSHSHDNHADDLPEEQSAPPTPWRDAGWQPPILPRFGPQRDGEPENDN